MQVLIVEDEQLAAERLQTLLENYDASIRVVGHLYSVKQAVQWLLQNPHPDILFLDIQLADGYSFEIFKQVAYRKPVIFTTAFDQYALEAFSHYSIAYLVKPIEADLLAQSMRKYKELCQPFSAVQAQQLLQQIQQPTYKRRLLAHVGQKMYFVNCEDIRYFSADDKLVYLVDREGNRMLVDMTLERLEKCLDPQQFFRLNRSYLVHLDSIAQMKPHINSRMKLWLRSGAKTEEVIMSRERVPDFRAWAEM